MDSVMKELRGGAMTPTIFGLEPPLVQSNNKHRHRYTYRERERERERRTDSGMVVALQ